MALSGTTRVGVGGRVGFELEGKQAGWLSKAVGGRARGKYLAVGERLGPSSAPSSRGVVSGVIHTPLQTEFGAGMSREFLDWITGSLGGSGAERDGAVIETDHNLNIVSQREQAQMLLTCLKLPKLDASAGKSAFTVAAELTPEFTRTVKGSGKFQPQAKVVRAPLCSSFTVEVGGELLKFATSVEFPVFQTKIAEERHGSQRLPSRQLADYGWVGDFVVTTAATQLEGLQAWFDAFVLQGKNTEADERTATVNVLAADMKTKVVEISLDGLGIYQLEPDEASASGADAPRRMVARMYCSKVTLKFDQAFEG